MKPLKLKRLNIISILLLFAFSSQAIVIRHDVEDSKYLAAPSDFLPLATFYVDGAHGTLIKPDWIITAAHATFCLQQGAYAAINGNKYEIASVFVNADYMPGKSHDIALVQLVEKVKGVLPAEMYAQRDELGKDIWFIGIGGTGNGLAGETIDNAENNGVLRKAQNRIIEANGPLLKFKFDRDASALPLEGVSGGGDSGGPAYITTNTGVKLLGVSSRYIDGKVGQYGITEIYSRVSYFSSWIEQVITGSESLRSEIATPKLKKLPAGITEEILPMVCQDIGIKNN